MMTGSLSRRDVVKLAGLLSRNLMVAPFLRIFGATQPAAEGRKNILILVFDAFSAYHISLYGYGRKTTPNLARLAERAIVYHNHFAGGNFTTPGTASLLTGVLPWTHRALQFNGQVENRFTSKSIFHAFNGFHRITYSHNPLVNTLFDQFNADLDDYIPLERLLLTNDGLINTLFHADEDISTLAWARIIKQDENQEYSYSLFLSEFYRKYQQNRVADLRQSFPLGLPYIRKDNYFVLEQAMEFLGAQLERIPRPFLGYFHFIPPHVPYRTRSEFHDFFKDDQLQPIIKPETVFTESYTPENLFKMQEQYDEYILYLDREFGRLFQHLEESGVLENTYLILTSDHGELFERGIWGHVNPVLYQPVVRVPLLIFEPGATNRTDIQATTSAVDLLPTLLYITGESAAEWAEGVILPPFSLKSPDPSRSIYAVEGRGNDPKRPLTEGSIMLVKGRYKLMYFFGYEKLGTKREHAELYDIKSDSEELNDLYPSEPELGKEMLNEIKLKLKEKDLPYL